MAQIEIVGYRHEYACAFAELNYQWIEKYYAIEPHDREILDQPYKHIIEPGGEIFFANSEGKPIGTAALINGNPESFELAKMAVDPAWQGSGIGRGLLISSIDHARAVGKGEIVLESNTKLVAAVNLYRSLGFSETALDPNSAYSRVNIRMRLAL